MRTSRFRSCAAALGIVAGLMAGCGGGGGDNSANGTSPPPDPGPGTGAQVAVSVIDSLGRPVGGATLRAAGASATTDAGGQATIELPTGGEQTLAVGKAGFAEQVKVIALDAGATTATLQAMLIEREAPQTIVAAEAGGSVSGKHGVKVTLPAGALVDAAGNPVSGAVALAMTPVDVTQLDVGAFPGLFEGVPTGGPRSGILSFGTAELVPTQGGAKLQLGPGKSAEVELPIYVRQHPDGRAIALGDTIALWSLDTTTGLWMQEGEGTVVAAAASPTGLALRATITHFSWWNADQLTARGFVDVTVNVTGTPPPAGTLVRLEARVTGGAGPTSVASDTFEFGTVRRVQLPAAPTVTRLSVRMELTDRNCVGELEVSPAPGATLAVSLPTNCVDVPVARIVRPQLSLATNSASDVIVQVLVDGPRADRIEVFADGPGGARIADIDAAIEVQPFHTVFWNTAAFAEGTYRLRARATRDGVSRDEPGVTVTVDRTPPQINSLAPVAGSDVSSSTQFQVQFSEPVNPLPFALDDVIAFTVAPVNGAAPVAQPFTATLDAGGTTLTVRPRATLPLGTVGLSWAGLRDAAGNAPAGTVAATFQTARQQPLFGRANVFSDMPPAIALDSAGRVIHARALEDATVEVARFDGPGFTLLGGAADNPAPRTPGQHPHQALVLTSHDEPILAYQREVNGAREVIVRRFAGGSWQDLGPAFTNVSVVPMRLVIDASDRPVLALKPNGSSVTEVHRFDPAAGSWTPLGSPAQAIGASFDQRLDLATLPSGDVVALVTQGFVASNATGLRAVKHDGAGWVELAGGMLAFSETFAQGFSGVIVGGSDGPWVWITQNSDPTPLRLLRYTGSGWEIHPVPRPAGANILQAPHAMVLANGRPVVAFNDFSLGAFVTRFVDGRFEPAFAAVHRAGHLALAANGAEVAIAYQDFVGNHLVAQLLFP
jgi:hypothetical protein